MRAKRQIRALFYRAYPKVVPLDWLFELEPESGVDDSNEVPPDCEPEPEFGVDDSNEVPPDCEFDPVFGVEGSKVVPPDCELELVFGVAGSNVVPPACEFEPEWFGLDGLDGLPA